jgi:hypothetical protein
VGINLIKEKREKSVSGNLTGDVSGERGAVQALNDNKEIVSQIMISFFIILLNITFLE